MTTLASGNPLGPFVEGLAAKFPPSTPSKGRYVSLEPRNPSHFDGLYDVLGGEENASIWDYMPSGPFVDRAEFHAALSSGLERFLNSFPYTIIDNASQKPVGSLALIYIDQQNRSIQAGHVLLSKALQRTIGPRRSCISSPALFLTPWSTGAMNGDVTASTSDRSVPLFDLGTALRACLGNT